MAKPAPPKGVPLRAGGTSPDEVIVPTDELATVFIPALDKLNHELNYAEWETKESRLGAAQIVAERSANWLGIRVDSIPRRIYGIRSGEFKSTTVRHADALLLALDIRIEEEDITHLPNGTPAATEMIEAYNAEHGLRPRKADNDALAKKLVRFKNGYLHHEKYLRKAEARRYAERLAWFLVLRRAVDEAIIEGEIVEEVELVAA